MRSWKKAATLLLVTFFLIPFAILPPVTVKAQSNTIVVPTDYPTIQKAIEKATDGDTILVKSGTYTENPINTTKSISIIGEGSPATTININCPVFQGQVYGYDVTSFGRAIDVNANNFTLAGLTINTNGGDIRFSGDNLKVTNNTIAAPFSVEGYHLHIVGNSFLRSHFKGGFGINYDYTLQLTMYLSTFSNNKVSYDNNMCETNFGGKYDVITGNTIFDTYLGIWVTPCFFSGNTVSGCLAPFNVASDNSVFTKNTINGDAYGFGAQGSNNILFANQITYCGMPYGDVNKHFPLDKADSNQSNLIYCNNFIGDSCPLHGIYWNKIDHFENGTLGNYWSDYKGTDSNGDGVGDASYLPANVNGTDFHPLMAPFNISAAPDLMPNWTQNINALVLASADGGSTPAFYLSGNLSSSQISNVTVSTNQTTAKTVVSFIVTGSDGSVGFSNLTIPKSAVPYGTAALIYIDGKSAKNQGYTQDADNYYVWYTTGLSTHEVSIRFANPSSQPPFANWIIPVTLFVVLAVAVASFLLYSKRRKVVNAS